MTGLGQFVRRHARIGGRLRIAIALVDGGGRQRAVLGQPRLHRGGAGLGRAGARHRLQSQPSVSRQRPAKHRLARADRPRPGAAVASHRPYPHLYGGWRHGQGAGDRAPLWHDGVAGHLDQPRPGQEREGDRAGHQDRAGQPPRHRPRDRRQRDPAVRRRLAPTSSTPISSACARRCPRASR